MLTPKQLQRFWSKVDKTSSPQCCWLWLAATLGGKYGRVCINGCYLYTHRVAWELLVGPIPTDKWVLHKCPGGSNPRCCNPDHLYLGTPLQNSADMISEGRSARGERHWCAKLTMVSVKAIRHLYATGEYTQAELATQFGVSTFVISLLLRHRTWKCVK
jgi:hypothetical protein